MLTIMESVVTPTTYLQHKSGQFAFTILKIQKQSFSGFSSNPSVHINYKLLFCQERFSFLYYSIDERMYFSVFQLKYILTSCLNSK